ncbi:DUF2059 domain-containing protein [Xinfangfangia sp. D13-10-4-6]|uniref:DUF2059 domain-containing protein n=1 Tax=Pseudogemmobacter hezensis TaxID=2737662 RepID=UPI001556ACF7|nr:DUF2059 domain-containing protein [Pseudogemmobacter hezensis]NPD15823.1 DUF2059 domain-containing protein [Pseudogemmobacter hezensis]
MRLPAALHSGCDSLQARSAAARAGVRRGGCGLLARLCLGLFLASSAPLVFVTPVAAQGVTQAATVDDLKASLGIPALFKVLAREGQDYGASLDDGMLGGRGGAGWRQTVMRIYEPSRLEARFSQVFQEAIGNQPGVIAEANAFFNTPLGQRVVTRERETRETLLDPDAKEAAEVEAGKLRDARSPRLRQIRRLIEAADLIEGNVASGLTGAAAFNEALSATLPEAQRLPEIDRMAQIWRQEGEIRASTGLWLLSFMTLAYAPLTDEELQAWVDFSASDSGRALNQALFTAYSETFREVMAELGHEVGLAALGKQI